MESFICFPGEKICDRCHGETHVWAWQKNYHRIYQNVMRKMTCLDTKRWSFTADHQIFGAKVEILFRSFHCKILGDKRKFWKGSPVFPIGTFQMEIRLPLQVSWVSYWFHVVTRIQSSAVRQSGNFRQMVNNTYRSYGPKIPHQNFRNFFINGKQPWFRFSWWNLSVAESHYFRRHPTRI